MVVIHIGMPPCQASREHDRILDIAAARIRRGGIDSLAVAEVMKDAGLTHGGFYRHFESREQLVGEATQRALSQGSAGSKAAARLGGRRGYTALVDGYLSARHRDHPESGCAVPCITDEVGRVGGSARTEYTNQVQEYVAMLADLIDNSDRKVRHREAVLLLSALVGAISIARAVDDAVLSKQILTNAAAALKKRAPG